jgi:hypothetical protein
MAGLVVGWVVVRFVVCWLVSVDVVVAVDMKCFLMWFVGGAGNGADDSLSPPIRPKRARFVPAHARFVTFSEELMYSQAVYL